MSKRQDWRSLRGAGGTLLGMLLAGSVLPAHAEVFTWNPAGASVPLAGAGSAFTADGIAGLHYLYDVTPPVGSPAIYPVDFIEQITEFTLGGVSVATPGLNGTPGAAGSYGLYLSMQAQVQQVGAGRSLSQPSDVADGRPRQQQRSSKFNPGQSSGVRQHRADRHRR